MDRQISLTAFSLIAATEVSVNVNKFWEEYWSLGVSEWGGDPPSLKLWGTSRRGRRTRGEGI